MATNHRPKTYPQTFFLPRPTSTSPQKPSFLSFAPRMASPEPRSPWRVRRQGRANRVSFRTWCMCRRRSMSMMISRLLRRKALTTRTLRTWRQRSRRLLVTDATWRSGRTCSQHKVEKRKDMVAEPAQGGRGAAREGTGHGGGTWRRGSGGNGTSARRSLGSWRRDGRSWAGGTSR